MKISFSIVTIHHIHPSDLNLLKLFTKQICFDLYTDLSSDFLAGYIITPNFVCFVCHLNHSLNWFVKHIHNHNSYYQPFALWCNNINSTGTEWHSQVHLKYFFKCNDSFVIYIFNGFKNKLNFLCFQYYT